MKRARAEHVVMPHQDGAAITVRAQPRATRNEIAGIRDGALLVRVTASPVDGAANIALLELLADRLGVAKTRLEIVAGASGRQKRIVIRGLDAPTIAGRLGLSLHD